MQHFLKIQRKNFCLKKFCAKRYRVNIWVSREKQSNPVSIHPRPANQVTLHWSFNIDTVAMSTSASDTASVSLFTLFVYLCS